jgi:hypothetical protein
MIRGSDVAKNAKKFQSVASADTAVWTWRAGAGTVVLSKEGLS